MADKSTRLIIDALRRAAADPAGLPLYGGKTSAGLFPASSSARAAAQRCLEDRLLRVTHTESRGKNLQEICTISDRGLEFLLRQLSPKEVLEDLVRTLDARQAQLAEAIQAVQRTQADIDAMKEMAEKVMQELLTRGADCTLPGSGNEVSENGQSQELMPALLAQLQRWQRANNSDDCPLPELYRALKSGLAGLAGLTVGGFHDGLRQLHDAEQIYLHPWTGPLYELPEPAFALLVGHEIAYYASEREEIGV